MASVTTDVSSNQSSGNSEGALESEFQFCIVGELKDDTHLLKAIETFNLPIVYSDDGFEFIDQGALFNTYYILKDFEGEVYSTLHKARQRILGPTIVMQCAEKNKEIPMPKHFIPLLHDMENLGIPKNFAPLFNAAMKNLVISFTGFRTKEELRLMVTRVRHMGGEIRKDFHFRETTHLIAHENSTTSEKYKYAASLGIPIMSKKWVHEVWSRRYDINCNATDEEFMEYKLKPFEGCRMTFVCQQESEKEHMAEVALKNGGKVLPPSDPNCTHVIVEDGCTVDATEFPGHATFVKSEWFWACIQMEAKAEEKIYPYENPCITSSSCVIPTKGNKRKRLESVAHQLAMELESFHENDYCASFDATRRSTEGIFSNSCSFLDATLSPDKTLDTPMDGKENDPSFLKSPPRFDMRSLSHRQQVCYELFQTESNYVGILNTIMTVFKEPLEHPGQMGGPLLAPAEIKIIFGNLPPIFEIHKKIRSELSLIVHSWSEEHSIGRVILNHASEFVKAYPPFVNFFEKTKEVLARCDASKPRFHAFLKRCQSKPECGRQTLQELLIRPVQRLPSIILLLTDIYKNTPEKLEDHSALDQAINVLKNVMTHINEDKRKTEGQVAMFDVVNDIENCPADLLSSQRCLVSKIDMVEETGLLNKKGGIITMFLFTDVAEFCRKKVKAVSTVKSPGGVSLSGTLKPQPKSYKHLLQMHLKHIRRVVDITETEDFKNYFAIVAWSADELKELLYAFSLNEDVDKSSFLQLLTRQVANSICKASSESLLTSLHPSSLALQSLDSTGNVLTKVMNKTRDKLGRALSMRRTPTKRQLSRAVSSMISPLRGTFGTSSGSVPILRLSSDVNLTQLEGESHSFMPSPVVGGKKLKASSLKVANYI